MDMDLSAHMPTKGVFMYPNPKGQTVVFFEDYSIR